MNLLEVHIRANNQKRYFVDGHRVSHDRFQGVKSTHDLDTFQTITNGLFVRQYCVARPRA